MMGMINRLQRMLDEAKRLHDIVERRWRTWMWKGCAGVVVLFVATWFLGSLLGGGNRNEASVVKHTWTMKETLTRR
jgi:hypothetical protein